MTQKKRSVIERLAVCSWSLQPNSPQDLIQKLAGTGIRRVQLALDPLHDRSGAWSDAPAELKRAGVEIVSGMFGCEGEDYSTLDTIRVTGGIAPEGTWEKNWENIRLTAALAKELGLKLVTFHAGFLPHDEKDPGFVKMLQRLSEAADAFKAAHVALGLETGQETAPDLLRLLKKLDRPNVGVNFDPANMILYVKVDPIAAFHTLGPWIRQVPHQGRGSHQDSGHVGTGSRGGRRRSGLACLFRGAGGTAFRRRFRDRARSRQSARRRHPNRQKNG